MIPASSISTLNYCGSSGAFRCPKKSRGKESQGNNDIVPLKSPSSEDRCCISLANHMAFTASEGLTEQGATSKGS